MTEGPTRESANARTGAGPPPLPPEDEDLLREAVEIFNAGGHYEAHDLFEHLWGPELFKGLVQASVAIHHYKVGNVAGIAGLPERVHQILHAQPAVAYGIDIAGFRAAFDAFFERIERGERPPVEELPTLRWAAGP